MNAAQVGRGGWVCSDKGGDGERLLCEEDTVNSTVFSTSFISNAVRAAASPIETLALCVNNNIPFQLSVCQVGRDEKGMQICTATDTDTIILIHF